MHVTFTFVVAEILGKKKMEKTLQVFLKDINWALAEHKQSEY